MHQDDADSRGTFISDPTEKPEKVCGICQGSGKPQYLPCLSLCTEAWCPGQMWEFPQAPQHVLEWLHVGVSTGDTLSPFLHRVPAPLTSQAGP